MKILNILGFVAGVFQVVCPMQETNSALPSLVDLQIQTRRAANALISDIDSIAQVSGSPTPSDSSLSSDNSVGFDACQRVTWAPNLVQMIERLDARN